MNRKFKFNINRILQLQKEEDPDEDEKLLMMKERIYAPIVWCRLSSGIRIQDLKERYYNQALDIIKNYYITEDILCKHSGMDTDFFSTESFVNMCLFHLKDTTSIVAMDESCGGTDIVAGICILRVVHRIDFGRIFSRTILNQGEAQAKCVQLKTALNRKVDIYADYNCDVFLRIYAVCVKPEYRRKGIGFAMMRMSFNVARALHVPIIMGIFGDRSIQSSALNLGFEIVAEIRYSEWKDKETNNLVFPNVDGATSCCALMIAKVEPEEYPDFLIEKPPEPVQDKKGKKDKKGGKNKGKGKSKKK